MSAAPLGLPGRVFLAVGAALLPLLLLETGARLFAAPPPPNTMPGLTASEIPDPDLLWRNKPGYATDDLEGPIDSRGFRRPEPKPGDGGGFRILSLGESTTFGFGLRWHETYSHLLEARLEAAGHDVEVLNAGTRGWTTYGSTRYLRLHIDDIKPDMVLFYHEINDFLPTTVRRLPYPGAGLTDSQEARILGARSWANRIIARSHFLRWLRLSLSRRQALAEMRAWAAQDRQDVLEVGYLPYGRLPSPGPDGEKPWMSNRNQLVRVPERERETLLRDLIDLTLRKGVRLILLHPVYPVSRPHRCVETHLASELKVPLIDLEDVLLADALSTGRRKADYFLRDDQFHPNELGHETFARAIADSLASGRYLPSPSRTD